MGQGTARRAGGARKGLACDGSIEVRYGTPANLDARGGELGQGGALPSSLRVRQNIFPNSVQIGPVKSSTPLGFDKIDQIQASAAGAGACGGRGRTSTPSHLMTSPPMAPSQTRSRRGRPAGIAETPISFLSVVGRVLFASTFMLSFYKEYKDVAKFGSDGAAAVKCLEPKFNLFVKQVSTNTGMALPNVQIQIVFWATFYLRVFDSRGYRCGSLMQILYLAFITPVMYDFYNYEMGSPDFVQLSTQFSQNLALCGALLFFIGMKNSIPRRHLGNSKRRVAKTKTT